MAGIRSTLRPNPVNIRPTLPYDLLLLLISSLESTSSLASLSKLQRCCKSYYALITPILYRCIHIRSDDQLQKFLTLDGGKKGRKAAKSHSNSISLSMSSTPRAEPLSPARTVVAAGRARAHSVGTELVRGLGLESPKKVEKRKAKEEAQRRQRATTITAASSPDSPSPSTSPHTSQLDLDAVSSRLGLKYTKAEAFWLVESVTLDVYPSRTSLKLASKLSTSTRAAIPRCSTLTLSPHALISLQGKLAQSQAPRILASYWASHAMEFVRPKFVVVDYSRPTTDLRSLLQKEESKQGWLDTMWGISAMVQQYGDVNLTLRGDEWGMIVPSPGTKVRIEHTNDSGSRSSPRPRHISARLQGQAALAGINNIAPAPGPNAIATATFVPDSAIAARAKLLVDRRAALVLGLRSSHVIAERLQSTRSIQWEVVDFFPPPLGRPDHDGDIASIMTGVTASDGSDEVWAEDDRRREDREVMDALLADLDNQCPELTREYGMIDQTGRRWLRCLTWVESENRGVMV